MSIIERAVHRIHQADSVQPGRDPLPRPVADPAPAPAPMPLPRAPGNPSIGPIAEIDLAELKNAGMITPDAERSQLSEEFRIIKRPLLNNAFRRGAAAISNANLVMVTSALPGEGKTFAAINLAMSIAQERDQTVLLVDGDVARTSGPGILGLPATFGLLDLLIDERLAFRDVLVRTNVEKLSLLQAGRPHPHATELLASEAMSLLLDEMARRYVDRLIIFDAPPLLVTTEAAVLAQRMGQVVLVIEAGRTPQAAVKEALTQLEKCNVFMLLNKGSGAPSENPFAYGAYGGYGRTRA